MQRTSWRAYSHFLHRDMECMIYGTGGKPVLVIPSQNGRYFDWDNFGMMELLSDWILAEKIQLFAVDTIDKETVSDETGNPHDRVRRHECWYNYVLEEALPHFLQVNGSGLRPMVTGVSMGAYHAGNFFFRRPDIFDGLIALSGVYDTRPIYGDYMDEVIYNNSPADFLAHMPPDHPWIGLYNRSRAVLCVGQGAWEGPLLDGTRRMDAVLKQKGIATWVDYWGFDVNHDWPWWKKQLRYFLPWVLEG